MLVHISKRNPLRAIRGDLDFVADRHDKGTNLTTRIATENDDSLAIGQLGRNEGHHFTTVGHIQPTSFHTHQNSDRERLNGSGCRPRPEHRKQATDDVPEQLMAEYYYDGVRL